MSPITLWLGDTQHMREHALQKFAKRKYPGRSLVLKFRLRSIAKKNPLVRKEARKWRYLRPRLPRT